MSTQNMDAFEKRLKTAAILYCAIVHVRVGSREENVFLKQLKFVPVFCKCAAGACFLFKGSISGDSGCDAG